jgi:hypothetical protein
VVAIGELGATLSDDRRVEPSSDVLAAPSVLVDGVASVVEPEAVFVEVDGSVAPDGAVIFPISF